MKKADAKKAWGRAANLVGMQVSAEAQKKKAAAEQLKAEMEARLEQM